MKRPWVRVLVLLPLLFGIVAVAACTESDKEDARNTAADAKQQAKDAWASLKTDGERLVDRVQTRNDPEAKQQLLDKCRDSLERLRKSDSSFADNVAKLCNQIRDADPGNSSAWNDIKSRIDQLNRDLSS